MLKELLKLKILIVDDDSITQKLLNPSFRFFSKKVQNTDNFKDFKNLIVIISVT